MQLRSAAAGVHHHSPRARLPRCCPGRYDELLSAMYEALAGSRFKEQEPTISASTAFDLTSHRIKLRL